MVSSQKNKKKIAILIRCSILSVIQTTLYSTLMIEMAAHHPHIDVSPMVWCGWYTFLEMSMNNEHYNKL